MYTKLTDTFTLANGVKIPVLGFGTWQTPSDGTAKQSVIDALKIGYRHIDTAACYGNEEDVGAGLQESGVARSDIFLTTKHWIAERGYTKAIAACEESLRKLKTDYVDLYLIHWPCVEKSSEKWAEINAGTWRAFEKLYKDGKIRAIGISNFLPEHIEALEKTAEIKPMVNQVEVHPGYTQSALVDWCQKHGILVEAWSALGCGAVLKDPTLVKLAEKYNKTTAQIALRFVLQLGVLPLTKSVNYDRIKSNSEIFDFELSDADMLMINTMHALGFSGLSPREASADVLLGGNYDID